MVYKSEQQEFVTSWNKTVNWARSKGLSQNDYMPVYQLDSQRLLAGDYTMSESERVRAILSSANLSANTVLPTDHPSPTNIIQNTRTDLANIATGLIPTRLASNIFDTIKDTFQHPTSVFNIQDPNSISQWVPGVSVVNELQHGGFSEVAEHPISSFLDVLPIADAAGTIIGKSALGDAAARAVGLTTGDQFAETSPIRLVGKAIGRIPTPGSSVAWARDESGKLALVRDSDGKIVTQHNTISSTYHKFAENHGISSTVADLSEGVTSISNKQSILLQKLIGPFAEQVNALTDPDRLQLHDLLATSGRDYPDLLSDSSIPLNIRKAIEAYKPVQEQLTEWALQSGDVVKVKFPDGKSYIYSGRSLTNGGVHLIDQARNDLDSAQEAFDKATAKANQIQDKIGTIRQSANFKSQYLNRVANRLYPYLRNTANDTSLNLPISPDALSDSLSYDKNLVAALFKTTPDALRKYNFTSLEEIFAPNGLINRIQSAIEKDDWNQVKLLSRRIVRIYQNDSFKSVFEYGTDSHGQAGDVLINIGQQANNLYNDAIQQVENTKDLDAALQGKYETSKRGGRKESVKYLTAKVKRAQDQFDKAVFQHPPDDFRPLYLDLYIKNLLQHEQGPAVLEHGANRLINEFHMDPDEVDKLRSDPRTLFELIDVISKGTESGTPFGNFGDIGAGEQIRNSALKEIARLRAEGFTPHYIPQISSNDLKDPHLGSYNVFISSKTIPTVSAAYERMWNFGASRYNVLGAVEHAARETLSRDGTSEFFDTYMPQFMHGRDDVVKMALRDNPILSKLPEQSVHDYLEQVIKNQYDLVQWDPESIFGVQSVNLNRTGDTYYIPRGIATALDKIVNRDQFPLSSLTSKGTKVFKMAILGYSPRYIAHIVFGGSFLLALRSSPDILKFTNIARQGLKDGSLPADLWTNATAEGAPDITYHYAGGRAMARHLLQESLEKKGIPIAAAKMSDYLSVIPDLTYKFTRYVTSMQRAMAYFDGYESAIKKGWMLDPDTGTRIPMTPERAMSEGVRHALTVMGDMRRMTPLERTLAQNVMPFYGWTKHVLTYVATYPMDHPYRAMFLSQLAEMNSNEVPTGLPTRIQNLFFLGSPDAMGNVSAIDVRALNPLRDIANYATWQGWLSQLNPAITAPFAAVDPQITFGSNVLYPNLSYNQLYGTTTSDAQGGPLAAAEQYIPELTTLDAALGLSSQYRNLKKQDPELYAKTIFESLNAPFLQVQHLNLRQIAAKNEIDRYKQAETAADTAFQTGQFQPLQGYPTVPDPQQTLYNVSPQYLQALYQKTLAATGLPAASALPSLPTPEGL